MQKFWLHKIKSLEQGLFLIGWFGLLLFFISYPIKIFDTSIVAHVIFALGIYSLSAINRIVFMVISLAGALYLMAAFALHVVTYFFLPEQIAVYSVFRANEIFPIVFLTLISIGVLLRVSTGALFVRYKDLMAYPLVILIDGIIISIILLQVLRYQEVSVIRATTIQQAQTVINILKIVIYEY